MLVDAGQRCGNDTVPVKTEGFFRRECHADPDETRRKQR
jgi:hypothetical protein